MHNMHEIPTTKILQPKLVTFHGNAVESACFQYHFQQKNNSKATHLCSMYWLHVHVCSTVDVHVLYARVFSDGEKTVTKWAHLWFYTNMYMYMDKKFLDDWKQRLIQLFKSFTKQVWTLNVIYNHNLAIPLTSAFLLRYLNMYLNPVWHYTETEKKLKAMGISQAVNYEENEEAGIPVGIMNTSSSFGQVAPPPYPAPQPISGFGNGNNTNYNTSSGCAGGYSSPTGPATQVWG